MKHFSAARFRASHDPPVSDVAALRGSTLSMEVSMLGTVLVISGALMLSLIGGVLANRGVGGAMGLRDCR